MIQALITNKKRPSVRMVAGSVSRMSKGFITVSSTANTKATITAVKILLSAISTPGNMAASIKTFTAEINIL